MRGSMGLLDNLIGMAAKGALGKVLGGVGGLGGAIQNQPAQQAPVHIGLLQHVMDMFANKQTGGLGSILDKLRGGGLSQQVASWVGTGPNQSVTGDQVQAALGQSQISQLAQKFGIPENMVAGHLAQILPELVNHVTPDGTMPDHSAIESALGALKGKLFGH
jgi:uncharacterized protein YidB (DUF937 family)